MTISIQVKTLIFQKIKNNFPLIAVFLLGFSAGIPLAMTGSTLSMWLSRIDINIKTIGMFSLVVLPFSFKFVWSPIFDNIAIPYFSKKIGFRKSWLLLIQTLLMLSIFFLGQISPIENIYFTALFATMVSFFSASQDILIDALRIEILDKEEQALGASLYVYGYRIAMLVSGAGSLMLSNFLDWKFVYLFMSLNILIGMLGVIIIQEPSYSAEKMLKVKKFNEVLKSILGLFKNKKFYAFAFFIIFIVSIYNYGVPSYICVAISLIFISYTKHIFKDFIPEAILDFCTRKDWIVISLFILLYKYSDTLLASLQSKFYVDHGFSNIEIASITKIFGFVMTMFGLFIGGLIYLKLKTFKSLFLAGILQILSNLIFLWVANSSHNVLGLTVAIAIENFTGSINTVVLIAYLSSLCSVKYSATQYALLSSFANVGRTVMSAPAGYIASSVGWNNFIIITALVGIPSLLILFKLRDNIKSYEN